MNQRHVRKNEWLCRNANECINSCCIIRWVQYSAFGLGWAECNSLNGETFDTSAPSINIFFFHICGANGGRQNEWGSEMKSEKTVCFFNKKRNAANNNTSCGTQRDCRNVGRGKKASQIQQQSTNVHKYIQMYTNVYNVCICVISSAISPYIRTWNTVNSKIWLQSYAIAEIWQKAINRLPCN